MALDATHYVSETELDDEGLTASVFGSSVRRERLVKAAARLVDLYCRHWFYDRTYAEGTELYLSGKGKPYLLLPAPIISVERIEVDWSDLNDWDEVDPTTYRLFDQDNDWQNPKIARIFGNLNPVIHDQTRLPEWPKGKRNIRVRCHLGMTVLEAPEAIKQAVMRIAYHDAELISDRYAEEARALRTGGVETKRVRERSITYRDRLLNGMLTGDPLVDNALTQWRRAIA